MICDEIRGCEIFCLIFFRKHRLFLLSRGIFRSTASMWIIRSSTCRKEEFLIVVQNKVIDLLLDSLDWKFIDLISNCRTNRLNRDRFLKFLLNLLLCFRLEKTSLKRFEWIKEAFLSSKCLLILEHFFWCILSHFTKTVDINLDLVLIVL